MQSITNCVIRRKVVSKQIGEAYWGYQPFNEGIFSFSIDQGDRLLKWIATPTFRS